MDWWNGGEYGTCIIHFFTVEDSVLIFKSHLTQLPDVLWTVFIPIVAHALINKYIPQLSRTGSSRTIPGINFPIFFHKYWSMLKRHAYTADGWFFSIPKLCTQCSIAILHSEASTPYTGQVYYVIITNMQNGQTRESWKQEDCDSPVLRWYSGRPVTLEMRSRSQNYSEPSYHREPSPCAS